MIVTVYNEHSQSIPALLIAYDSTGQELQRDNIPAGGMEYVRPGTATQWLFTVPGYKDAAYHDLDSYDNYTVEMIPKNSWIVPVLVGAGAYWIWRMVSK